MSNIYLKLQQRALRPKGDDIEPYKTVCLALNETKSQSLLTHFEIKDSTRLIDWLIDWLSMVLHLRQHNIGLQTASYTSNAWDSSNRK